MRDGSIVTFNKNEKGRRDCNNYERQKDTPCTETGGVCNYA